MRIKLLRNMGSNEGPVAYAKAGTEHDIAKAKAEELIGRGFAEEIKQVRRSRRKTEDETPKEEN